MHLKEFVIIFDLDDTLIHTKDMNKYFPEKVHKNIFAYDKDNPDFSEGSCGKCLYKDLFNNEFTVFKRGGFDYLIELLKSDFDEKYDVCIFTASRMPDDFIYTSLKKLFGDLFEDIPIFRAMYQESVENLKQYIGSRNFLLIDDSDEIAEFKISKIYDSRKIDNDTMNRHSILLKRFDPFIYKPFQFEFNVDLFDIVNGTIFDNNYKNIVNNIYEEIIEKIQKAYNKNINSSLVSNQRKLEDQNAVKMESIRNRILKDMKIKNILFM